MRKQQLEELLAAINYLEEQPIATNEKYDILVDIIVTAYEIEKKGGEI